MTTKDTTQAHEHGSIEGWFEPITKDEFENVYKRFSRVESELVRAKAKIQDLRLLLAASLAMIVGLAVIVLMQAVL